MKFIQRIISIVFISLLSLNGAKAMDAKQIAEHEVLIWKAYYNKDLLSASQQMKPWLERNYGVSDATQILPSYLEVMSAFGNMPQDSRKDEYNTKILPLLIYTYELIKKTSKYSSFDPVLVAQKELEWWVARRLPDELNVENVKSIMAQAYALLYGGEAKTYESSAFFRATAGRYRDIYQYKWGLAETKWQHIQGALASAYEELNRVLKSNQN